MHRKQLRRITVFLLALVMLLSSAVPVMAAGKGHGKGKGNNKHVEVQVKGKGHGRGHHGNGKITFKLEFDDVDREAAWAMKYIASLAARKVFEGYTDGTFQPNKPVSRIEAITTAVRLMGLREEAEDPKKWNKDIWFEDEKHIRKKHQWAVGYVIVAQEAGLFADDPGKLQPEKAADRLWVTELLIKALDLEADAKANRNAQLGFTDRHEIPSNKIGYVKVAVDKGIITGYTNNTFRPNKPVTRAELAAMLERAEGLLPDDDEDDKDPVDGRASGVIFSEVTNQTLVLRKNGEIKVYALDPNTFVFRDGKKSSISSLRVGDTVFIREYNNLVIFVEVLEQSKDEQWTFTATGYYHSLLFNTNGRVFAITLRNSLLDTSHTNTYQLAEDVVIVGDLNKLEAGYFVKLEGKDGLVKKVTIGDQSFRVEGDISYFVLNSNAQIASIAIRHTVNGKSQTTIYSVSSDVRITGNLTLLGEGQPVTIIGNDQVITEIVIRS